VGALFFLYVGTENALGGWAASYARRLSGEPGSAWALAPSFFWAALLVGRGLAPAILRRVEEANLALTGLVIAAFGVTTLVTTQSLAGVFAGAAVAGLGLASVFPITVAMLSHIFGPLATRVAGGMFALAGLGGATLPWLVGFLSNRYDSLRAGLAVPLLASLVMLALHFGHARARLGTALSAQK
jgi:fucose permease